MLNKVCFFLSRLWNVRPLNKTRYTPRYTPWLIQEPAKNQVRIMTGVAGGPLRAVFANILPRDDRAGQMLASDGNLYPCPATSASLFGASWNRVVAGGRARPSERPCPMQARLRDDLPRSISTVLCCTLAVGLTKESIETDWAIHLCISSQSDGFLLGRQ